MRNDRTRLTSLAAAAGLLLLAAPARAQYREYYVRGRVVDEQKQPLGGVEIQLRDPATSRTFNMKTDDKGEFKFAGLPHATYKVRFSREGYASVDDEWDFSARQDRMQRVEVPDVVLASGAHVREVQRLAGAKAGVEEAAELMQKGDLDAAIRAAEKVLQDSPEDPNALYYLGLSYLGQRRYADAVGPLTRVSELSPGFPGAHLALGDCYRALGERAKALAAYDRSRELDPSHVTAAYNAGLILFDENRIEEALDRFTSGIALEPDDAELNEMAGRCYVHEAKFELALDHLLKARRATTDADKAKLLDTLIEQTRALVR